MPPIIALALCTGFVLFLLWIERQQARELSPALWIPTLWLMAMGSKPLGIWFGTVGTNEIGSPFDRLFLTGLALAGLIVLARHRFGFAKALHENQWLLALLGYMLLSTLWSDITFISFKRWVREAIVVIMGLVILSEPDPRQAMESLMRRSVYILIPFSLLLIKYYPGLGVDFGRWSGQVMWVGVTVHKNCLGRLCLIAAFFLLWTLYRRWRSGRLFAADRYPVLADASVVLIALFLLRGSENAYSATSVATFVVGITTFLGLVWLRKKSIPPPKIGFLVFLALLIGFGIAAPLTGGANVAFFSSIFGRNETLTGRTETWAELVPVVESHPLFGSGLGSFWTSERRELYDMSHGHNGYLDILLELGTVGLGLYAILLLSFGRRLHKALGEDYEWASLGISFLLMSLVYNVSESTLNSLPEQMTAVVVLLSLAIPARGSAPVTICAADITTSSLAGSGS